MNTMTCPSEEDWEALDRRVLAEERIRAWTVRLVLFAVATCVVFVLLYLIATHAETGGYDAWSQACGGQRHEPVMGK